ncbi:MAG: MgtC/SapB family protein [archaeon]
MEISVVVLRFVITFVLSLLFGVDRQRAHKPIGFGTFIFVAVGSCGLAITAINLSPEAPLPLLSGIITGVGFLGAGALIKTTDKIFGFTSAASIWIFSIFGLLIGVGEYDVGIILYVLIWFVLIFDTILERKGIGSYQKKVHVITNMVINEREIKTLIGTKRCKLISTDIDKKNNKMAVSYLVEGTRDDINAMPLKLFRKEWFDSCKIE